MDINYISNMIFCWRFCRYTNYLVHNGLYVSDLVEYASIFLKIGSDDVLISAIGYDMYPVEFTC